MSSPSQTSSYAWSFYNDRGQSLADAPSLPLPLT
jgi:hypothetical protein